jgi:hypothetical protein
MKEIVDQVANSVAEFIIENRYDYYTGLFIETFSMTEKDIDLSLKDLPDKEMYDDIKGWINEDIEYFNDMVNSCMKKKIKYILDEGFGVMRNNRLFLYTFDEVEQINNKI